MGTGSSATMKIQASWVDKAPSGEGPRTTSARRPTWVAVTPGAIGAGERISDLIQEDMVAKGIPWYSIVGIVFLSSNAGADRAALRLGDTAASQPRDIPIGEDVYIPATEVHEMFLAMATPAPVLLEILYA